MDNSQQQYLYYCMWKQRTLLVLFVMLVLWWSKKKERKNRAKRVKYGPLVKRDIWRSTELIRLIHTSERTCLRQLRMYPAVFYKLCAHLRDKKLLADTIHVSVEEQLAMFLKIVGQYHTHSSVGFALWRSEETVSRYFNIVLCALVKLAREIICTRSTDTHAKITTNPNKFYPYFEGCIGALDGTHIRARVPSKYVDRFRGRKPYPTQNVLAAVDFDLRFTYVLAGWEGSAHDSAVLHDALSRPNGLKIPEGKYYLADAGYATRKGILPPYRGVRYHLQEFQGPNDPKSPKELFNHRHSSLRTTVERAFAAIKNRFKWLAPVFFPTLKAWTFRTISAGVLSACFHS
ncbi:protein ALP1-like [Triticum aestivum]|uniref:protein ALP1-like n=1 Tax=Triticum aestivum TaxID=4565 RepID=UPI001D00391D|nr:protein ALP1-like [Triticum aestivum]